MSTIDDRSAIAVPAEIVERSRAATARAVAAYDEIMSLYEEWHAIGNAIYDIPAVCGADVGDRPAWRGSDDFAAVWGAADQAGGADGLRDVLEAIAVELAHHLGPDQLGYVATDDLHDDAEAAVVRARWLVGVTERPRLPSPV